jgi:hypothetical protein
MLLGCNSIVVGFFFIPAMHEAHQSSGQSVHAGQVQGYQRARTQ